MTMVSFMVRQLLHSIPVANVLWYDVANTSLGGLTTVADAIGVAYESWSIVGQVSALENIDCLVRVWDGSGPFSQVIQPGVFPVNGTVGGDPVPPNVALLISTSHAGPRPNRGRVYLAGLSEASWDGDSWDATITGHANTLANDLHDNVPATWVIARPNPAANTAIGHEVTDFVVRGFAGSQRGRRF